MSDGLGTFAGVDHASRAAWFAEFMDAANALPEYVHIHDDLTAALGADLTGRHLLEVGTGTGDHARRLAGRVGPDGRVVATDLSDAMLEEARRRTADAGLPVEYRRADVTALDLPDGAFDGAWAKTVLMHCPDPDAAFDELVRVLRPGGRLAVFDFDLDTCVVDHPDTATTRTVLQALSDAQPHNGNARRAFRLMRERGLRDVTVTAHTPVMPYEFFRITVQLGRLDEARADGSRLLSSEELDRWLRPLAEADERGTFFSAMTGFVVAGTVPGT